LLKNILHYISFLISAEVNDFKPNLCDSVLFQIANIFVQIELCKIAGIPLWYFKIFHNTRCQRDYWYEQTRIAQVRL